MLTRLQGAYAELIATQPRLLWRKPSSLTWAQAAAIPENWLTAYQTSRAIGGLKEGETILVHAGASGVGTSAIQLARSFGALVVRSFAAISPYSLCLQKEYLRHGWYGRKVSLLGEGHEGNESVQLQNARLGKGDQRPERRCGRAAGLCGQELLGEQSRRLGSRWSDGAYWPAFRMLSHIRRFDRLT